MFVRQPVGTETEYGYHETALRLSASLITGSASVDIDYPKGLGSQRRRPRCPRTSARTLLAGSRVGTKTHIVPEAFNFLIGQRGASANAHGVPNHWAQAGSCTRSLACRLPVHGAKGWAKCLLHGCPVATRASVLWAPRPLVCQGAHPTAHIPGLLERRIRSHKASQAGDHVETHAQFTPEAPLRWLLAK